MNGGEFSYDGETIYITRSGYTGEDGYEISISNEKITKLCEELLSKNKIAMIGLGARDSLRLEAGLCLYGHDLDKTTSPIEADLMFGIAKNRRATFDFVGGDRCKGSCRKRNYKKKSWD